MTLPAGMYVELEKIPQLQHSKCRRCGYAIHRFGVFVWFTTNGDRCPDNSDHVPGEIF